MRLVLALAIMTIPALAQEHHHPPQDGALHEKFYSTWLMPNGNAERTQSCCNLKDCYPTRFRQVAGQWFALRREDGHWLPVPDAKLEQNQSDPRESPDGQGHVCASPPPANNVYCATLGSGT